ncbi:MAG: hypothetical protein ABR936_15415 [Bacteroidota bacterium]|jgi:hypothetical protein
MAQSNSTKTTEFVVQPERTHFHHMLAKNPNYFGNIPGSKLKVNYKLIAETVYEQLTCAGYNPDTENMLATFEIKKSVGFSGNLCTTGSFEYLRFYLDFHDGHGFIDQGIVAINVHDILAANDCNGNSIFPIKYAATLKKKASNSFYCDNPVLPTLRVILSWGTEPPADSPNWQPVWGNILDCDVQLKPSLKLNPKDFSIDLSKYLALAVNSPYLTSKQLAEITGADISKLTPQAQLPNLADLVKKSEELKVPASRFVFKTVYNMVKYPTSEMTMMDKAILANAKIDVGQLIDKLSIVTPMDASKADVDYEELECVGLDYNTESLVATIKIKKNIGYSGGLCDVGSKEYISFWIDWDNKCSWQYLNTVELKVHDIQMVGNGLYYSVLLPLDATYHKKICNTPNIVRFRSVLSWDVAPSTTDPDKLEYYGNRVDAHIQIKPGVALNPGDVIPLFNIIGGIDVDHVDDVTGLTKPGSFFAFNGLSVPPGAPFGGLIVLNGPSFPGYRYKIKITNLNDGTVTYASASFTVVGYLPYAPWVQYTAQAVDADGYYHFLDPAKNTLNVLARFTPGTEDNFLVEMEVDTIPGVFSKTIQIDNTAPDIHLQVDDNGDCTHYKIGDTITGHYYAYDKYILSWNFASTWGGGTSGTSNTPGLPGVPFSIVTQANAYPCGAVSLGAWDKTIVNSQSVGHYTTASYNICLRNS